MVIALVVVYTEDWNIREGHLTLSWIKRCHKEMIPKTRKIINKTTRTSSFLLSL